MKNPAFNRQSSFFSSVLLGVCLAQWSMAPVAQTVKQSGAADQALRKAQGMLRQLTEEKTALAAENKILSEQAAQLQASVKQLEPLQGEVERYKSGLETWREAHGSMQNQLNHEREKQRQLMAKMQDLVSQAQSIQRDNQLLVAAVKEREVWIGQCAEKNQQLVAANQQIIDNFQGKGFWQKLADLEPLTGLGYVETENQLDAFQFKLEDLTVTAFEDPADGQTVPE